jgi:hypothetical protein
MFSRSSNIFQSIDCAYPVIKETVPESARGYHANNKYPGFPPIMNDGRSITTTWQSESSVNADLVERSGIKSNWEYRKYLTDNAQQIMEYNFRESSNDTGYYKRPIDIPSIQTNEVKGFHNTPYVYSSKLDNSNPLGYSSSDLKELYMSREQLASRKVVPAIAQTSVRNK